MSCPLPQNAKLTQAETTLGSSDTLMSQLVTEQLNFRVKERSGDLEPHSNKLGAEGSRNPALLSLGHISSGCGLSKNLPKGVARQKPSSSLGHL